MFRRTLLLALPSLTLAGCVGISPGTEQPTIVFFNADSAALDETSPVNGEYTLEVSTPGTSRPLTQLRHFKRARTRLVRLTLRDGTAAFGRLAAVEGTELTFSPVDAATSRDVAGDPLTIAFADIASAAVEVELTRARAGEDDADGKS